MTKGADPDFAHRTRTNVWFQEVAPGSYVVHGATISPTTGRYITSTESNNPETDANPQDAP